MKIFLTLTFLLFLNREGVCEKLQASDRVKVDGAKLEAVQAEVLEPLAPKEFPEADENWVFEAPNYWVEPEKSRGKVSAPRDYLAVRTQNGIIQYLIPTSETPDGFRAATEVFTTRVH